MNYRFLIALALLVLATSACEKDADTQAGRVPATSGTSAAHQAGMCGEHGVPEALCTKCNPPLANVFKAKGDWCEEHGFPESFCPTCNPDAEFPEVGATPDATADWCGSHGLPESKCTKCNPGLIPKFKAAGDWCAEHEFPESVCPTCNPQAAPSEAAQASDWCLEHALPESQCTKCSPSLIPHYKETGDWCSEHGFPESVCPVCHPQKPPDGAEKGAIEGRVVRFQTPDLEKAAGLATAQARRTEASASVACTARVAFDGDRVADVRAIVPGIVRRVQIELGDTVKSGAPLFQLESTRVGEIQGALQGARARARTAQANLERQRELKENEIASARQVEMAEQELAAAEAEARAAAATLRMAGAAQAAPSGRYTLTAPLAGSIVRRPAVVGLLATESTSLATVADTSVMWALCDVTESDAGRIALGQRMQVTIDGSEKEPVHGEITWIAAEVDPRTRTVTARADIPNPNGRFRANQFARARIETGAPQAAVSVPREAVQRVGDFEVVFVRTAPGTYQPKVVDRFGDGERVQVQGGVKDGDTVVTTGAVLLRTEIMPGSIGAGCCEVDPPSKD